MNRVTFHGRTQAFFAALPPASGINRGVAVALGRVFLVTDHAHLLALDRHTRALLWDTEMADWRQNYGATQAPLAVAGLVVAGISGGDEGVRGFLAAFDPRHRQGGVALLDRAEARRAGVRASPMTYMFDGRQHIVVAAGRSILSFALLD